MMMSVGSRGWLWTAGLLLAVLSTCLTDDNAASPRPPVASSNTTTISAGTNTSQANVTEKSNVTTNVTEPTPLKPSPPSPSKKSTTAALPPAPPSTTKAPPPPPSSTTLSTTVTSKGTVKPPTPGSPTTTTTTTNPTTNTMSSGAQKMSGFDLGSFIGGIVLMLAILAVAYFGCRFYNSRRGVRYRTIDEHEAII